MRTLMIADIRRNNGDPNFIVELVRRYSAKYPEASMEWLVTRDQIQLVSGEPIIGQADAFEVGWATRVHERVAQLCRTTVGPRPEFVFLSFDTILLERCKKSLAEAGVELNAVHFGTLFGMAKSGALITTKDRVGASPNFRHTVQSGQKLTYDRFEPTSAGLHTHIQVPIDELEKLVKCVLIDGGHTSPQLALPQKDLRPQMTYRDSRVAAAGPLLRPVLSSVVDSGMQQGWLKRFRRVPEKTGTEMIYITEPDSRVSVDLRPIPVLADPPPGIVIPSLPDPAPAESAVSVSTPPISSSNRRETRDRMFQEKISSARIGSLPESRELIFDVLARVVSATNSHLLYLPQIFSAVEKGVRELALEKNYTAEQNWPIAVRCNRRLTLWARVLIGDSGEAIEDTIGCDSRRIVNLKDEFTLWCEAYLAEHIIKQLGSISYDDDPYYLGLTIYRRGGNNRIDPDILKAKAATVLEFLFNNGRIFMDLNRKIRCVE